MKVKLWRIKTDSLSMIRGYGSCDSEDEEEFYGFDLHGGTQEYADRFSEMPFDFTVRHFRQGVNTEEEMNLAHGNLAAPAELPQEDIRNDGNLIATLNSADDEQINEDDYDLEEEVPRKRTKKEIRKLDSVKKRR